MVPVWASPRRSVGGIGRPDERRMRADPVGAIAGAMRFGSKVTILDEPAGHLGVKGTAKAIGLVRGLRDQGVTAILVSHDMGHVFAAWGRVVAMALGRVVLDRPVAEATIDGVNAVP